MSEKCENCRWWNASVASTSEGRQGECRAAPPIAWKYENWTLPKKLWPETSEGDWCGRFEHRDDRASRLLSTSYMRRSTDEAA